MHPGQLLEKVEAFLATERGRQILRSGTSFELSRITSWIAAANRSVAKSNRHPSGTARTSSSFEPRPNSRSEFQRERRTKRLSAIAAEQDEASRRRAIKTRKMVIVMAIDLTGWCG